MSISLIIGACAIYVGLIVFSYEFRHLNHIKRMKDLITHTEIIQEDNDNMVEFTKNLRDASEELLIDFKVMTSIAQDNYSEEEINELFRERKIEYKKNGNIWGDDLFDGEK